MNKKQKMTNQALQRLVAKLERRNNKLNKQVESLTMDGLEARKALTRIWSYMKANPHRECVKNYEIVPLISAAINAGMRDNGYRRENKTSNNCGFWPLASDMEGRKGAVKKNKTA